MTGTTTVDTAIDQRFGRLLEYLQDGWDIDPPIFVRPLWHTLYRQKDAYHFILRRNEALHLLVIPACPEIDQFVRERNLPLNRL
ncbi:MAG: hypothetical protein ACRERD_27270 [Candidatus Binatia bacterium]